MGSCEKVHKHGLIDMMPYYVHSELGVRVLRELWVKHGIFYPLRKKWGRTFLKSTYSHKGVSYGNTLHEGIKFDSSELQVQQTHRYLKNRMPPGKQKNNKKHGAQIISSD